MRRFFAQAKELSSGRAVIKGPDARHLRTILRVKPGDEIFLFDGQGWDYRAQIVEATSLGISICVLDRLRSVSESSVSIAIGQAVLKGRKMDRIVRQLTELGVTAFLPFLADRSVSRPDAKSLALKTKRWQTIAREALKQCGRFRQPHIAPTVPFETILEATRPYDTKILFDCGQADQKAPSPLTSNNAVGSVVGLVGPEGGFSQEEIVMACRSGFVREAVGPRILEADTAAVACAALLQHVFGDLRPTRYPHSQQPEK
jgi:16S rRNA (uracil1498-N3)-methyltransferase